MARKQIPVPPPRTYSLTRDIQHMLRCPHCGAYENHPNGKGVVIRAFKFTDSQGITWSQCLHCSGYYDDDLNPTPDNHDPERGWF